MSDSVREAYNRDWKPEWQSPSNVGEKCHSEEIYTAGYQAATAAADAEWRGVVEMLVEALNWIEISAASEQHQKPSYVALKSIENCAVKALAQAEKLMGRK